MAPSDLDLEGRLRDLRFRAGAEAAPPPDLAATVRALHRRQRRNRVRLAAAGLAAAMIFIGVPVLASSLDAQRSETAGPSDPTPRGEQVLFEQPTRGSLAGDAEWLAGIAALPIPLTQLATAPTDRSIDVRHTAFAGNVVDGRVALELLRLTDGSYAQAWFTGSWQARPEEMTLSELAPAQRSGPLALIDAQDPGLGPSVITVVAFPGDEVQVLTGRTVSASGETLDRWATLPTLDGAGGLAVDVHPGWFSDLYVRIARDGKRGDAVPLRLTERAETAPPHQLAVADPRGLRGVVDEQVLQDAVWSLAMRYGAVVDRLPLTLLAGGQVPGGSPDNTLLLGATFTSGATVGFGAGYVHGYNGMYIASTETAPAGTSVIDRVFAVVLEDTLTVSGPMRGASAEIYDADSQLIATVPLVDGAGVAPAPLQEPQSVRILDAAGDEVVTAATTEVDD